MRSVERRDLIQQLSQEMGLSDKAEDSKRVEYVAGANALKINKAAEIHNDKEEKLKIKEKSFEAQIEEVLLRRGRADGKVML